MRVKLAGCQRVYVIFNGMYSSPRSALPRSPACHTILKWTLQVNNGSGLKCAAYWAL